ncbi:MAG: EamA family transporter [Candidatus Methanomethylophilaceae archaeon]|nr:EamA family transporter [Candidatus Methanomethylophilaceae archaeon]
MKNSGIAALCVVAAASLWGLIGLFTRSLAGAGLSPIEIAEVRCSVTAACVLVILAAFDRKLLRISVRDVWMFVGTGALSIALFNVLYFTATTMLTLSMAAVLLYTAPCFVMLMSAAVFKEKVTRKKALALGAAFLGCALTAGVVGGVGSIDAVGIAVGVGSGLGYAMYSIFGKIALRKYHPFTITFYTFLVAALCLLPFSDVSNIASAAVSGSAPMMLSLGVVVTLVPYFLYTYGLSRMDAGKAAVLAFVEPMVATLVGFALFGESPGMPELAGIALILASVVLLNAGSEMTSEQHED